MARAVQEVWVAEGDVRRPRLDLLADVREHDVPRHDEEAPAVDGRDRAVPAEMLAAAGRLDGARELEPAVLVEVRVLLQRRELRPARHGEVELREDGAGSRVRPLCSERHSPGARPLPPASPRARSRFRASSTRASSASPPRTESATRDRRYSALRVA